MLAFSAGFTPDNDQLRIRVRSRSAKAPRGLALGVLMDGRHVADIEVAAGKRGGMEFAVAVGGLALTDQLDLVDAATGRSILPAPHDLRPMFDFRMTHYAVADGRVSGRFSVEHMHDRLWVECTAGARSIARGFAMRDEPGGTGYSFSHIMLSALPINEPAVLMPWIAGRPMPGLAIKVTAREVGYAGFVDSVTPGLISGWAMHLRQPTERVSLDLLIDGEVIDTVVADQPRPDLAAHGLGDGFSAFEIAIKPDKAFQQPRQVSVVVSGTHLELCNSPVLALPAPSLHGFFDRLHGTSAHGWVMDRLDPKTPVVVEAVCDGRVMASAEAKLFRGDLLDAGLNEGFCAFKIDIGAQLLDMLGREVSVRVAGTDLVLPGSPKIATQNANMLRYLRPLRGMDPALLPRMKRMMNHRAGPSGVSIVMPVYNTPRGVADPGAGERADAVV